MEKYGNIQGEKEEKDFLFFKHFKILLTMRE